MTDKTETLLPCPFCGSLSLDVEEMAAPPFVMCHNCGAYGPDTTKPDATRSDVVETWNKRAAVGADRLRQMPSDEKIMITLRKHGALATTNAVSAVRDMLSRYGSSQPAVSAEPVAVLRHALEYAQAWISATPHGDNCHLDPDHALGQNCECGKESILAHIESALEARAAPAAQEPMGYLACNPETGKPEWGEGCICADNVYSPEETGTIGRPVVFAAPVAAQAHVTDEMVTRFLGWHLPQDFAPGAGISFKPSPNPLCWPVGTDLFRDPQARAMLEYVLTGVEK